MERDNRRYKRINSTYNVSYSKVNAPDSNVTYSAKAKNISLTGLLFFSPDFISIGQLIRIKVHLPGIKYCFPPQTHVKTDCYTLLAKVIRANPSKDGKGFDIAINFMNVSRDENWALMDYLYAKDKDEEGA